MFNDKRQRTIVEEMSPSFLRVHLVMGLIFSFCFISGCSVVRECSTCLAIGKRSNHSLAAKLCLQTLHHYYRIFGEGKSKTMGIFQHLVDMMSDIQANAHVRDSEFSRWCFWWYLSSVITIVGTAPLPQSILFVRRWRTSKSEPTADDLPDFAA